GRQKRHAQGNRGWRIHHGRGRGRDRIVPGLVRLECADRTIHRGEPRVVHAIGRRPRAAIWLATICSHLPGLTGCHRADGLTLMGRSKELGDGAMKLLSYLTVAGCLLALGSVAQASTPYDGSWDLVFVTRAGACDPSYNFSVNISDGLVTH